MQKFCSRGFRLRNSATTPDRAAPMYPWEINEPPRRQGSLAAKCGQEVFRLRKGKPVAGLSVTS